MNAKISENIVTLTGTVKAFSKLKTKENESFFFLTLQTTVDVPSKNGSLKEKTDTHEVIIVGPVSELVHPHVQLDKCISLVGKRVIRRHDGKENEAIFSTLIYADKCRIESTPKEHKNTIILNGEILASPIKGKSKRGDAYLFFNLATTSKFQGNVEKRTIHNIQLWGQGATTTAKKVVPGQSCKIIGTLKTEIKNGKNGHPIYCSTIVAQGTKLDSQSAV